jgi:hypothetical protein
VTLRPHLTLPERPHLRHDVTGGACAQRPKSTYHWQIHCYHPRRLFCGEDVLAASCGELAMLQTEDETRRGPGVPAQRHRASGSGTVKTAAYRFYFAWLIPASLVIGLYLRTREWLFDRSLWLDELMVTYSITHRGFAGLVRPLSLNQAAPVGWLWAERASIDLFGMNDLALRFPCWAASIVALGVFPQVARVIIGRSAAPAATLIFATAPQLIFYSADAKQYSSDVACALLALLVTTKLCQSRPTMRRAVIWGLTCAVLVWCSQPVIPVCAVCGLVLLLMWFREWDTLLPVVAGGVILGISVAWDWVVALKPQTTIVNLQSYWVNAGGYPPLKQTFSADIHWLTAAATTTEEFLDISKPYLALFLMACGLTVVALRRSHFQGLLLALPIAAAITLAVTEHYPFARRLALYLYPIAVMLLAAPLALSDLQRNGTARWWRSAAVATSAAALIAVTAPGIALGLDKAAHPDEEATGRQAVAFVGQHQHSGDLVLVMTGDASVLTMAFYGPHYHVREAGVFFLRSAGDRACTDPFSNLHGVTRVWLVFEALAHGQPLNRNQIYVWYMAVDGRLVLTYNGLSGAGAYLFDLSRSRANKPPPAPPAARSECLRIRLPPDDGH